MYFLLAVLLSAGLFLASRKVVVNVVNFVVSVVVNLIILYFCLPVLSLSWPGMSVLVLFNFVYFLCVALITEYNDSYDVCNMSKTNFLASLVYGVFAIIVLIINPIMSSWALWHHTEYRALIGNIEEGNFSSETTPIEISQIRTVNDTLAAKLAEKRLGEDLGLGSQVDIGRMNIQQINGKLYWVGPLNHSGFFKWWFNKKGTPGYVMVSATDEKDVRLVRKLNDQPLFIKYNAGSCLGDDPLRYLYEHGFKNRGLTDFTFELDDNGRPYYTVTKYENKVGFFGGDAVGTVILDVQTGEIKEYSIEETPVWVDRIRPEHFIVEQVDNWGRFIHGWGNSWMVKKEVIQSTPGMSLVYGKDGRSYWYTGISSSGKDEGTIGFMMIDTRTKKTKLYRQVGATETAAKASAEGAVQEKGYEATFPIFYNVSGVPTYFCCLKDAEGLVKEMAFVSVENYNTYGVGQTKEQAYRQYLSALNTKGNSADINSNVQKFFVSGRVLRKGTEMTSNNTAYYFLISGHENKFFYAGSGLSNELVLTNIGDSVVIEFTEGKNKIVDAVSFENFFLNPKAEAEAR